LQALGNLDLPVERYVEIAQKKTGSLFAASALCGAVMGDGTAREIEALRTFGEAFGVAFQMKDDLLDVTADERSIGKPAANDLAEHKTTLPLIAALAGGGLGFRKLVNAFYDQPSGDALAAVLAGIDQTGGVAGTQTEIARYAEKAKRALEPIADGAAKRELARLTDALLS
jgi:octaprenyl-diphosphate synthase